MNLESLPSAEVTPVVVFDMSGLRVPEPLTPTEIIEPESLLGTDSALALSAQVQQFAEAHRGTAGVGIKFSKFADGRAYSIAARLREAGFQGELHAVGDINQELLFLLKRVGFTHAHIPDPGVTHLATSIVTPFAGHYQAGLDGSKAPWQSIDQ